MSFVVPDRIRRYCSYFFWRSTCETYFDSSSWHCFVDRACGDTKWLPHGTVLVEYANRQSCCLQLDSGRSLDQIIRDFVILEFIARRRIEELARARSNIGGEAPHTRHRKRHGAVLQGQRQT